MIFYFIHLFFFFFKQKTAYEMRISDWSSDVCSSDLKVQQLGELVTSTGADALDLDVLAGVLLAAVESASADEKEAWRAKGSAFFQGRGRKAGRSTGGNAGGGSKTGAGETQG